MLDRSSINKRYPDAWMQTYTGKAVYPLEFDSSMVCIEDIAWSLSHQCRYAGHSSRFYSVAEHSIHLLSAVPEHLKLAALLHDASEAYLIDVPRPIKWALTNYSDIECRIQRVIAEWASIEVADFEAIKQYDLAILRDEQEALLPKAPRSWNVPDGLGLKNRIQIFGASMEEVYFLFLFHYNKLRGRDG